MERQGNGYGAPYRCPACDYRLLKIPGSQLKPCPNCGARLLRAPRKEEPRAT